METGYFKFLETGSSGPVLEIKPVNGTVWMTANDIADLFGVYTPTINKNLKEIFRDSLLRENKVMKEFRYICPKHGECIRIYYNLQVIIFLSFRIKTIYTKIFREWVFRSVMNIAKRDSALMDCHLIVKYSSFNLN